MQAASDLTGLVGRVPVQGRPADSHVLSDVLAGTHIAQLTAMGYRVTLDPAA
jgi:hypothetical protein